MIRGMLALGALSLTLTGCYNFHTVAEGKVYRSAQPLEEEMSARVRKHHIKTVLRLRNSSEFWRDQTVEGAESEGACVVEIYLSAHKYPKKVDLVRIIEVFEKGDYPILIHCKAGADRTGLVSALYVLWAGGTMERAREELAAIPYGHFSTPNGTERMGKTLDLYEAWMPAMGVAQWAREVYECPPDQDNAEAFHLANAESAKAYRKSLHKLAQQVEIEDSNQ
ncbi:MAG: tyrosine-protein phosphatase [Planctomycetes bacterium]|nr:tyrosine-protein phosphatase [Planctomycetota bacterium]